MNVLGTLLALESVKGKEAEAELARETVHTARRVEISNPYLHCDI